MAPAKFICTLDLAPSKCCQRERVGRRIIQAGEATKRYKGSVGEKKRLGKEMGELRGEEEMRRGKRSRERRRGRGRKGGKGRGKS